MAAEKVLDNIDHWIDCYMAGMSISQISKQTGIVRHSVTRQFIKKGVVLRTRSQAEALKWKVIKQTPGGIERQCSAAWDASRNSNRELELAAIRLYKTQNLGKRLIAEELGTSLSNVDRIFRKHNILNSMPAARRAVSFSKLKTGSIISNHE